MTTLRSFGRLACLLAVLSGSPGALAMPAPQGNELQRDQEEILRKAQRLRDLMETLLERYRAEGRTEYVKLLQGGLDHLREAGLLEDVAGIRDRLRDVALNEALRKQGEVVEELERLLAILRNRRSVENLDREIETTTKLIEAVDQLLERQSELQDQTQSATRAEPSAEELAWLERLATLAREQAAEAERNANRSGPRAPILEDALHRVEQLLERHQQLDQRAGQQLAGEGAVPQQVRDERFRLGSLDQELRDLFEQSARQRALERAAGAARDLARTLGTDNHDAQREALSQLQGRLATVPPTEDPEADDLEPMRDQVERLDPVEDRTALSEASEELAARAAAEAERLRAALPEANQGLAAKLTAAAQALAGTESPRPGSAGAQLEEAAKLLAEARALQEQDRDNEALTRLSQASRALDEARRRHEAEHPDASQQAADMAAESSQVARQLRQIPEARTEGTPDREAAGALDSAEKALRQAAESLAEGRTDQATPARQGVEQAGEQLRAAHEQLAAALAAENAGRADEMTAAAARQAELQQRAAQLQQQMQGGDAGMSSEQRQAADPAMQRAQEHMENAQRALENGQQATAAGEQRAAEQALTEAGERAAANRPLDPDQQQAMEQLAANQEQLEEDIIRLAKEVEERDNEAAQRALERAAAAAQRAEQAMREGDARTADEQQEQAVEELERAREELAEERDRYQGLRHEELLFRIQEELTAFLEKQRPVTIETAEIAESLAGEQVSRRTRRKLNELGDTESELATKAEFLRTSLEQENNLVFSHALRANQEDLAEIARRLGGRSPDPGEVTNLLQRDVETRTEKLIAALERERERQAQENRNGGQNGQNRDGGDQHAQQPLVPILAELQMLKSMEEDMLASTEQMQLLFESRGGDAIGDLETTLLERLANRHHAVTEIFLQLKAQLQQALQPPSDDNEGEPDPDTGKDRKR